MIHFLDFFDLCLSWLSSRPRLEEELLCLSLSFEGELFEDFEWLFELLLDEWWCLSLSRLLQNQR